jgi:hypothetical protein
MTGHGGQRQAADAQRGQEGCGGLAHATPPQPDGEDEARARVEPPHHGTGDGGLCRDAAGGIDHTRPSCPAATPWWPGVAQATCSAFLQSAKTQRVQAPFSGVNGLGGS